MTGARRKRKCDGMDQDEVYAQVPVTGDISTRDLFTVLYPYIDFSTAVYGRSEYKSMLIKIRQLRRYRLICVSKIVKTLLYYTRVKG